MLILAAAVLLSAQVSAEAIEKEQIAKEFAIMLRGGGEAYEFLGSNGFGYGYGYDYGDEYSDELQHDRRLWGISWSNLFCTFLSVETCTQTHITSHHITV
jgi:hypothetical protein